MEKSKNQTKICHPEFVLDYWQFASLALRKYFSTKNSTHSTCSQGRDLAALQPSHLPKSAISGSVHCGIERNLSEYPNGKMLKQVQHDKFNVTNLTPLKRVAFTLAEVLITLGIIGVVAALTIPTLVSNYQTKSWATASAVFERQLEDGLKMMNSQQVLANQGTTEKFVEELQKHVKINKVCDNSHLTDCMSDEITVPILDINAESYNNETKKITDLKTASDIGQESWNTNIVGLQLANGMSALLAYNPICKQNPFDANYSGTGCVSVVYDVNGFSSPNENSKDVRLMNAKLSKCAFKIGGTCMGTPFKATNYLTMQECNDNKDTLNINYCGSNADHWAAVLQTCGGKSKVPMLHREIRDIARYIYHNKELTGFRYSDITMDYDRANGLGFNVAEGNNFFLWAQEETYTNTNGTHAYYREFRSDYFTAYQAARTTDYFWGLCIVK